MELDVIVKAVDVAVSVSMHSLVTAAVAVTVGFFSRSIVVDAIVYLDVRFVVEFDAAVDFVFRDFKLLTPDSQPVFD